MAGSQSKALPRWVTLTLQSHFTTSMHFHCLQNPPSLIVPTASNIPSNLYSSYLQENTRTPPPPLPPLNHLPPYSSPAPHRHPNLVVPFSLSLKYHTLHKHIHPHHLPSVPLLLYHPRDTSIATVVIVIIRCHRGHRHRLWIYDAVQDRCGAVWKLDPARSWM